MDHDPVEQSAVDLRQAKGQLRDVARGVCDGAHRFRKRVSEVHGLLRSVVLRDRSSTRE
jgi:hypothetical protein